MKLSEWLFGRMDRRERRADRPLQLESADPPVVERGARRAGTIGPEVWSVWADVGVTTPWVGLCGDRIAIACVQQRPADATLVAALGEIGSALAAGPG